MEHTTLIKDVTEATFAVDVVEASSVRPVVVDFWAAWCAPCRQLAPLLERAAARHVGEVDLVKLDIDRAPTLARRFGVSGIPAVKAFRDGRVAREFVGLQPEQVVARFFADLAPSPADRLVASAADAADPEAAYRQALELQPDHPAATRGLAEMLLQRGEVEEATRLLERLPADVDAQRLLAGVRLAADRRDDAALADLRARAADGAPRARLELGRALAAAGAHGEALESLVAAAADPATRDEAREAAVAVFRLLGDDDELVRAWRPRLARALF